MRWFINAYQELFFNISSKSDNGTFSKNIVLNQNVEIYPINIQKLFSSEIEKISESLIKFKKIKKEADKLLNFQII